MLMVLYTRRTSSPAGRRTTRSHHDDGRLEPGPQVANAAHQHSQTGRLRMNVRAFVAAAVIVGCTVPSAGQTRSPGPDVIQRSGFIFKGTVRRLASSNVLALASTATTIVVRVDEILKSPKALEGFRGREVTVQLRRATPLKVGQQAVFYTSGLLYGESLAVKEEATLTAPADSKRLATEIAESERQTSEQAIRARVTSAALIITGKVIDVAAVGAEDQSRRRSEHDPELWRATVAVANVLKGQRAASGQVPVLFAHSTDERWILSPKYTAGQQGIFLLHREQLAPQGFSTLHQLDFQPLSQLDLVRRLIGTGR
jgi:hypothetical protein